MSDNVEDGQNIDDLVDYNDFDSRDLGSKDDMDSFNDDILKFYEDHKKNINAKTNEATNAQRPISSYQRIIVTENKNDISLRSKDKEDKELYNDYEQSLEEVENKESLNVDYDNKEFEDIKNRLNNFVSSNKISKDKFCDNVNLFLNFDDFKEMFKKIRFDCSNKELKILFCHLNPNIKERYILIKNLFQNIKLDFKNIVLEKTDTQYDLKKINNEFKNLHSEILEIVKKDFLQDNNKKRMNLHSAKPKVNKFNLTSYNNFNNQENLILKSSNDFSNVNSQSNKIKSRPATTSRIMLNSLKSTSDINSKNTEIPKVEIKTLLKENLQKLKDEEIMIRQKFDKRQKEFIKDCMQKIIEANKICKELQINKSFSTITDNKGSVHCEIIDRTKDGQFFHRIELKAFIVEWRILNKAYIQSDTHRLGRVNSSNHLSHDGRANYNSTSPQKLEKTEIRKQIKKVLINSIRLKMKLKQQVNSLRHKCYIDEKIILEHLNLPSGK